MAAEDAYQQFIRAVERFTGRSIEEIRKTPICESRRAQEPKRDSFTISSWFPFIGRGNILRGQTVSRDEIETQFEKDLKK